MAVIMPLFFILISSNNDYKIANQLDRKVAFRQTMIFVVAKNNNP
tara:strand:- start:341 stop:475 length:135 start_codon:yes stop_codon:yes gene_type:complete